MNIPKTANIGILDKGEKESMGYWISEVRLGYLELVEGKWADMVGAFLLGNAEALNIVNIQLTGTCLMSSYYHT